MNLFAMWNNAKIIKIYERVIKKTCEKIGVKWYMVGVMRYNMGIGGISKIRESLVLYKEVSYMYN